MKTENFNLEKALKEVRKISLTSSEKRAIFDQLVLRIESQSQKVKPKNILWGYEFFSATIFSRKISYALASVMIFTIVGGSLVYAAAEDSLPGEPLYEFKIHVNEPVQAVFAWTPVAKAKIEAKRTERRLNEMETLAEQGVLTLPASDLVKEHLEMHISAFEKNETKVNNRKNEKNRSQVEKIRNNLEKRIDEHTRALGRIREGSDENSQRAIDDVEDALNSILKKENKIENNESDQSDLDDEKDINEAENTPKENDGLLNGDGLPSNLPASVKDWKKDNIDPNNRRGND